MGRVILVCAIVAGVMGVAWTTWYFVEAKALHSESRERWPAGLGSVDDAVKRRPRHDESPAAAELARMAKPAGFDFGRKGKNATPKEALNDFFESSIAAPGAARLPTPSGAGTSFLAAHSAQLDEIRSLLLERGDSIAWEEDFERGEDAPIPNLLTHGIDADAHDAMHRWLVERDRR